MKLSIIIPTHNRTDYLKECLVAVNDEKARLPEHEIIVIDDGSSEAEIKRNQYLCRRYGAYWFGHDRNRGMAVARNSGIMKAVGEWIAFIDDDIRVEQGWGDAVMKALSSVPPDVVGIEGRVSGSGEGLWDREVEVSEGGACLTCHIFYKREALLSAGCFDEQFEFEGPFHEDQELAVRMMRLGRIVFEASVSAEHMPRKVRLLKYLLSTPARIEKILRADFYLYRKHPEAYHTFRHAKTFYGTYFSVLFKYLSTSFKRRSAESVRAHPLQAVVLAISCLIAQMRALMMLPYFIRRGRVVTSPREVWFAAAIPGSSQGGVNRLMLGLAEGLRRRGFRVKMIYQGNPAGGYPAFSLVLAIRLLLRLFNPPGWIIARSTDAFFSLLLRKMLPLSTRIIVQNHGWEEYVFEIQKKLSAAIIENPVTWKARLLRFPMLRATLHMADRCLCGTIDDMRWIGGRYPVVRSKLRYVPNGVVCQRHTDAADREMRSPEFLCVGTLTWRKNLTYALELFKRIATARQDARLFCVGTGREPGEGFNDDGGRVTFIPSVPMETIGEWYERCPFFIHTARYEGGHSLALLEAMSGGAVAFVSPVPSSLEIVRHNRNGIVLSGANPDKDAALIMTVVDDTEMVRELSSHARRTAFRNRWNRQVDRLYRVLNERGAL
jgi:glycosyltransferase involved in cell wall biosynthesis